MERLWESMEAGEFRLRRDRKLRKTPFIDHNGKTCIYTEEDFLLDERFPPHDPRYIVLRAHCFRTADEEIGGSEKIDPKEILIGNKNYRQLDPDDPRCELCESGDMIPVKKRFFTSKYRPDWSLWRGLWRRIRAMMSI